MRFEIETASLSSTVRSMESEVQKITQIAQKLHNALKELDGSWDGPSHDVFEAEYQQDQETLINMRNQINDVIRGLQEARDRYDKCEDAVSADIKKIAI